MTATTAVYVPRRSPARALSRLWASLGAAPAGRRVPGTVPVAIGAMVVMTVVAVVVVPAGANLWYADALSHLTVARRILDSDHPGFQQLGTVWLPVPHLLLLPFVWSLTLWSTGWAGAMLGIGCLGVTAASLYRICARLGFGRIPRLVGVCGVVLNANILYLHTTALTEPVLIASMMAAVAGLTHGATATRPLSGGELAVFAGLPAAAACLSRYEGWVLVVSMALFVLLADYPRMRAARPHPLRFVLLRRVLPTIAPPCLALVWWLAYNFAMFGDPLDFMIGPYSAHAQQQVVVQQGILTTQGNLGVSMHVYNWAVLDLVGIVLVVLGFAGLLAAVLLDGLRVVTLVIGVLFGTYVFEIASLYFGQTVMLTQHSLPTGYFNVRYGISPLPFFAVGTAALLQYGRRWLPRVADIVGIGVLAVVVGQAVWVAQAPTSRSPVVDEGQHLQDGRANAAAAYLRSHYRGGGILLDDSVASNGIIPLIHVPVRHFVIRAAGAAFTDALAHPTLHARWILVSTSTGADSLDTPDAVYKDMELNPQLFSSYSRVFSDAGHALYELGR
jgi:hypothetical protein